MARYPSITVYAHNAAEARIFEWVKNTAELESRSVANVVLQLITEAWEAANMPPSEKPEPTQGRLLQRLDQLENIVKAGFNHIEQYGVNGRLNEVLHKEHPDIDFSKLIGEDIEDVFG